MTSTESRDAPVESEREEGEIVDEIDELSDISSEEEFLLRQRLHVLESYNNVLERKKAKSSVSDTGNQQGLDLLSADLSEVSAEEDILLDKNYISKNVKDTKQKYHKHKRKKQHFVSAETKSKGTKKKSYSKKKLQLKIISEASSEESDDEYRNKRRKLENAVSVNAIKIDTSSLQERIKKMLGVAQSLPKIIDKIPKTDDIKEKCEFSPKNNEIFDSECTQKINKSTNSEVVLKVLEKSPVNVENKPLEIIPENKDIKENKADSDEDLELLRQHALNTKMTKNKDNVEQSSTNDQVKATEDDKLSDILSEEEDSDTAELRLICLKSALLKKAIEMKKKQKLQARLSQSSLSLPDDNILEKKTENDNNTDIESVDMEIGSDGEDKDVSKESKTLTNETNVAVIINENQKMLNKEEALELEEDEDLLRAKLLTSLSKNLPSLIDTSILEGIKSPEKKPPKLKKPVKQQKPSIEVKPTNNVAEEKKFVINVGDSDSEAEHEATKNLTKMHMKLSEQSDFQDKLDIFLKSTRMEVENEKNVCDNTALTPTKFVPKTVKHLPKSEQIEYKNLVRRMAELEKIKQARQSLLENKGQGKEMLKPRNVSIDSFQLLSTNNAEEQIAMSRKKIAEESSAILRLKEEETKLIQKQKIVATELRNINTAITLNKKQLKSAQIRLANIRAQHQRLINSSNFRHSNGRLQQINRLNTKAVPKTQKENTPNMEEYKNPIAQKCVRVSVVNDLKEDRNDLPSSKLSVHLDVANNIKTVRVPVKTEVKSKFCQEVSQKHDENSDADEKRIVVEVNAKDLEENISLNDGNNKSLESVKRLEQSDDYESPLQAFSSASWQEDPNAVLCPYDISGNCKDSDCKYLHPKPSNFIQ